MPGTPWDGDEREAARLEYREPGVHIGPHNVARATRAARDRRWRIAIRSSEERPRRRPEGIPKRPMRGSPRVEFGMRLVARIGVDKGDDVMFHGNGQFERMGVVGGLLGNFFREIVVQIIGALRAWWGS